MNTPETSDEPLDKLGMTDEQWEWFQNATRGYGDQDENGIDLSLLRENLRLTPTERLDRLQSAIDFIYGREHDSPHPRFLEIIEALNVEEVRYVIIGGVAMRLHGSAHITDDMDFCYDRAAGNLSRLAAVLAPHHPSLRGAPPGLPFVLDARTLKAGLNFTLSIDIGALDLLGEVPGVVSFADLWENSVLMWVHGQSVRVASLNDLVAMKRAAGRDKDRKHLIEIEHMQQDAQGLKQNNNK